MVTDQLSIPLLRLSSPSPPAQETPRRRYYVETG